jgi:signal transduction histidine kinase
MRTLIFISGVTSLILFICMCYIRKRQKTYDGFVYWIFAALSNSAGMFLLSTRGILPDYLTTLVSNTLLVLSVVLINTGLSLFSGARPYKKTYILLLSLFVIVFYYYTYVVPSLVERAAVFSVFQIMLCAIMVIIAYRDLPRVLARRNYILFWFLIFTVVWPFLRLVASFFETDIPADLMNAGISYQLNFLGSIAAYIVLLVGLIIINAQRIEQEMVKTKDQVKTITGLIPICANCKKIRDDQGSWSQLEAYLNKNADLDFSHAICPECMEKLYPEKTTQNKPVQEI